MSFYLEYNSGDSSLSNILGQYTSVQFVIQHENQSDVARSSKKMLNFMKLVLVRS